MISRVPDSAAAPTLAQFVGSSMDLVDHFLVEQQSLTAVEQFSSQHDAGSCSVPGERYQALLPLREPASGEQYAFEVNLDRCSGCKACVTACHSLNGLDEEETWRHVGLLHDSSQVRMQQTVTTACHHCLEPACAQGCPTLAYEKDPQTGIVRHLDDQCFGCQYCILKCPYDVPQFNPKKGIVRKCDMCVGRLRAGEAPACAQACPTQAIRIVLVEIAEVRRDPEGSFALPGTPDPRITLPASRYVSRRGIPEKLLPVDAHQIRPEHAHMALIFMLVASQIAAGFWFFHAIRTMAELANGSHVNPSSGFPFLECTGLAWVVGALALGPLHLGKPWLAWKAFLGWRRSWLSREIIAFNILAGTATLATFFSLGAWMNHLWPIWPLFKLEFLFHPVPLAASLCASALAGFGIVYASAMVYRDTPRPLWATRDTLWRFLLSALLGGGAAYLMTGGWNPWVAVSLLPVLFIKLSIEARVLRHRDDEDPGPLWKAAQLMTGRLGIIWRTRIANGLGGVMVPLALFSRPELHGLLYAAFLLITCGELLERYLFFTTGIAPRMPGGR